MLIRHPSKYLVLLVYYVTLFSTTYLITIYNSFIHSHLMYGLLVWGFQSMRVEKLQKKAIRVLVNRPYISHTTPIFKELRILIITDLYHVQLYT